MVSAELIGDRVCVRDGILKSITNTEADTCHMDLGCVRFATQRGPAGLRGARRMGEAQRALTCA